MEKNKVCTQEQLASLCDQAIAALVREGQFGALLADDEEDDQPSLGTGLVLRQRNGAHKATPAPAAGAFWKLFVETGCLGRVTEQVNKFLIARKSPQELLPQYPWRVTLILYAAEGGVETGGTAAALEQEQGMTDHYDMTPHCAVTLSLTGDGDAPGLYWSCHRERRPLHLDAGDIAILARGVLHGVSRVERKKARVVTSARYPNPHRLGSDIFEISKMRQCNWK